MASRDSRQRFEGIELLRFILALGVCFYHYYYYGPHARLVPFAPVDGAGFGYLMFGVEAFFAVSGFVIVLSTANRTPAEFLIARMARLGPTLLVASSVTLLVYYALDVEPRIPHAAFRYLFSISFFPLARLSGGLDWSLWSLSFEIRFYFLVFLCMWFFDVRRWALPFAVSLLVLDACRLLCSHFLGVPFPSRIDLMRDYAPFFALGILIYHRVSTPRNSVLWFAALIMALGLSCVRSTQLFEQLNYLTLHVRPARLADGILVATSILVLMIVGVRRVNSARLARIFRAAGRASYPLYVVHQLCGYWIINFMTLHVGLRLDFRPALILVMVGSSLAFGNWVEPWLISMYKRVLTDAWAVAEGLWQPRRRAADRPLVENWRPDTAAVLASDRRIRE